MRTTRIAFICTGNICRSPMAEVVMASLVASADVASRIEVTSAGTANWHVGSPMDPRARTALDRAGFPGTGSLAEHANEDFVARQDMLVVMTREQRNDLRAVADRYGVTIHLLRSLIDATHDLDLADPYYGNDQDFDDCLTTIIRSCQELVLMLHPEDEPFEV